ncbi:MAG: hypothetical protein WD469_02035 [Paenibacillaceae bacterium]
MSDEIKLLINAVIKNQELARAKQDAFENEVLNFRKETMDFRNETAEFRNEMNKRNHHFEERFDHIDSELRSIKRHVAVNEREMDSLITRVEKIEQNTNH